MPRNPRPAWRGIGGRHAAESGAGIGRNTQSPALSTLTPRQRVVGINIKSSRRLISGPARRSRYPISEEIMVREKAAPKKSRSSTKSAIKRTRPSESGGSTPGSKRSAKKRNSTPPITALDAAPSLTERVEAERERIFKAVSIILCCWYAMVTKWEVDDHEYMIPAFETVCDLLNDAAEELEGIASACEKLG